MILNKFLYVTGNLHSCDFLNKIILPNIIALNHVFRYNYFNSRATIVCLAYNHNLDQNSKTFKLQT